MAGLMKREPGYEEADVFSRFDQLFDQWARNPFGSFAFPHGAVPNWHGPGAVPAWHGPGEIQLEEYRQDGTLVVRADLPGIDPDKDVQVTVSGGMLHIDAQRREEDKREGRGYLRQEVRYGALSRSLPLSRGVTETDVTATYKDGVLEIRVPEPKHEEARKIAIRRS